MGRVLYPWTSRAEKTYRPCQKHKCLTVHLSLSLWSPSVKQFRLKHAQKHNCSRAPTRLNTTENNSDMSCTQDTTAFSPKVYFNWNTSVRWLKTPKRVTIRYTTVASVNCGRLLAFRQGVLRFWAILGFHLASFGTFVSKFRDLDCLAVEDVT